MRDRAVRLLLVADAADAADVIALDLERGGWTATVARVSDAPALTARLAERPTGWDAVIADEASSLGPQKTLGIVRRSSEDVPVVVVRHSPEDRAYVDGVPASGDPRASRLERAIEQALLERSLRVERHELRDQLVVAERLASVGFLVAGVAHEINNPLSAIIANHEFLRNELARLAALGHDVKEARDSLKDAADAAVVIRQVVRDLRTFSRGGPTEEIGVVDARAVVESAVRMTWHEVRGRAHVVRDYGEVPLVRANEARLSQVFLNLLINAAHAITPGDPTNNEIHAATRTDAEGNFVLEIRDTGCGIPKDHIPYIFDAYFTTKPQGRGTGLGLAVSHRIVASLGGRMTVESVVGKGTSFSVVLPGAPPDLP